MTFREYNGEGIYSAGLDVDNECFGEISKVIKTKTTFDDITFCQLIIMERTISSDIPQKEKVAKLMATFYRPTFEKKFNNDDQEMEQQHESLIYDLPSAIVIYLYNRLVELRNGFINEKYGGVIYSNGGSGGSEPSKLEVLFTKIFFWYERQRSIAKELGMKMSDVLDMSANEALFELAYQSSKANIENQKIKERSKK